MKSEKLEAAKRLENERYRYFKPNGRQEEFIKKIGNGVVFVGIFSGANGVGKTALAINILANIIWGQSNPYFGHEIFKNFPYPKRGRIGTESKNVEEIGSIDVEIKTWWPKRKWEGIKGGRTWITQYKTDTGWLFDKMSYEQETREWESATLGLAVFDEPPPKDIFAATVARMRQGGMILIFMTPLTNASWIADNLIDHSNQKSCVVYADIEDNCKIHGTNGILEHSHIKQMIENMDQDEIEARVHGRFMHLSNVILGNSFKREWHVASNNLQAPAGCQWFHVVDPARGKPWAMAWGWVDLRGQIIFDREYPMEDWLRIKESKLTIRDYVEIIHRMDEKQFMEWRIIDRHFANARNDYGTTLKQDLENKFGLEFQNSYNCEEEVETGIQKVKDYLGFLTSKPIDSLNFPRLLIKERCRNIIRSLERWDRNSETLRPNADSPYKDHFDLARYVCGANLSVNIYKPMLERKLGYVMGR